MGGAWQNLRWFIAYWISRMGARLGKYLPTRVWYALLTPFADIAFVIMRRHRRALIANLARVVGEDEARPTAKRVFRNFARYVVDFYQLPRLDKAVLKRRIDFDDWEKLNDAMAEGKGGLFITLHLGQAELGGAAMAAYDSPLHVVAETMPYPPMDEFIQQLRSDLGMKVIPANKATMGVLRCLNRGGGLAMMVDAVEPGDGVMVDFFGAPAEFSTAPARIALRTGSRVMPGVVARQPHDPTRLAPIIDFDVRYDTTGDEEADVRALTQAIATSLEKQVRRFADQWFAFRPVWNGNVPRKTNGAWRLHALSAGMHLGGRLPKPVSYAIARFGADLAFRFRKGARADVLDNMRHVMGPDASPDAVEANAREVFRNVARYYVDLIRVPHSDLRAQMDKTIRLHGLDKLQSRLADGQGVVVATAHFGNPELAVQVGAILGIDMLVLAEPLQPPEFAEMMKRLRSTFGPRYEDVSFSVVAESIRHLRAGKCLAIACERDIQRNGTPIPFFGVEASMPLGAAELAARTGAALLPAYCKRSSDGFDIYFEDPIDLRNTGNAKEDAIANTCILLKRIEPWIASDPGQWMVLDRIWKPVKAKPRLRNRVLTRASSS
jgi:KDO2-lipid IV(A) lauroyltransferase